MYLLSNSLIIPSSKPNYMDKYIKEKESLLTSEEKDILLQCDIIQEKVKNREEKLEEEQDKEIRQKVLMSIQTYRAKKEVLETEIEHVKKHLEELTSKKRVLDADGEQICKHKYKKSRDASYLHNGPKCFYCDVTYDTCTCTNCDW